LCECTVGVDVNGVDDRDGAALVLTSIVVHVVIIVSHSGTIRTTRLSSSLAVASTWQAGSDLPKEPQHHLGRTPAVEDSVSISTMFTR